MLIVLDYPFNKFGITSLPKETVRLFKEEALKSLYLDMQIYHLQPANRLEKLQPALISGTIIHYIVVCEQILNEKWLLTQNELTMEYICMGRYPYKEYLTRYRFEKYMKQVQEYKDLWMNIKV